MPERKRPISLVERAAERLAETDRAEIETTENPKAEPRRSTVERAIARSEARAEAQRVSFKPAPEPRRRPVQEPPHAPPNDGPSSRRRENYAEIDLSELESWGFVTPDGPRTKLREEFRIVKRPLLQVALSARRSANTNNNVIMVTSACPGEGKTFTTINLAMSVAAEQGLNVLLIDLDIFKRDLSSIFGLDNAHGLLDLLVDERLGVPDVLVHTNIGNLTVLPAGRADEQAPELFASPQMRILMQDIATRYQDRIVIIDTPPVLASSEAGVLAEHSGQILMVVEAEGTSKAALEDAVSRLRSDQVSFILNKDTYVEKTGGYGGYVDYYYDKKTT